jgi:hypothetical protein
MPASRAGLQDDRRFPPDNGAAICRVCAQLVERESFPSRVVVQMPSPRPRIAREELANAASIKILGAETSEARRASTRDAIVDDAFAALYM